MSLSAFDDISTPPVLLTKPNTKLQTNIFRSSWVQLTCINVSCLQRMDVSRKKLYNNDLLYAGFNQDQSCFCVGTETGFRIYNTDPVRCQERQDTQGGGVKYAEMLFRLVISLWWLGETWDILIPGVTTLLWWEEERIRGILPTKSVSGMISRRRWSLSLSSVLTCWQWGWGETG